MNPAWKQGRPLMAGHYWWRYGPDAPPEIVRVWYDATRGEWRTAAFGGGSLGPGGEYYTLPIPYPLVNP